jgi:hypothetical protein
MKNNNYYKNVFLPTLKKYEPYELKALLLLKLHLNYENIKYSFNKNSKYDISLNINDNIIKYEIKTDEKSLKTNNIFIEYKSFNKLSGISTTEADYYIINHTIDFYLIKTNDILKLIDDNEYLFIKVVNNASKAEGYIFEKYKIIDKSIKIN